MSEEAKKESKVRWISGTITGTKPTADNKSIVVSVDTGTPKKEAKEGTKPNYNFTVFFPAEAAEKLAAAKGKIQFKAYENEGKDSQLKFNVTKGLLSSFGPAKEKKAPAADSPAM